MGAESALEMRRERSRLRDFLIIIELLEKLAYDFMVPLHHEIIMMRGPPGVREDEAGLRYRRSNGGSL